MSRSEFSRLRLLTVAALVAVFAVIGLLTLDRDTSDAQTRTPFVFSSSSVSAITVEQGRNLSYAVPKLQGVKAPYGACYSATVSLAASGGNLNGLNVNGFGTISNVGNGKAIKIKGRPTAVLTKQTYTVTATCTFWPGGAGLQHKPADATYTIDITATARQAVPMAFASSSKGHVKLVKDTALTSGGANRIISPPALNGDKVGTVIYSISPTSLPSGLSFSTSNGQITGTPDAVAAKQTYTVTATDSTSPTPQTSTFTIDLEVIDVLSFPSPTQSIEVYLNDPDTDVTIQQPSKPLATLRWYVRGLGQSTPALADLGLRFKTDYSAIEAHGRPTASPGEYRYEVKVVDAGTGNDLQEAKFILTITVHPQKVLQFATTHLELQAVDVNAAVSIDAPNVLYPDGAVSYAISPALPSGLTFDTNTGAIGGTAPASPVAKTRYTVTATDSKQGTPQTAQFTFDLIVKPASGMAFVPNQLGTQSSPIEVEVGEPSSNTFSWTKPTLVNVPANCLPVPWTELDRQDGSGFVTEDKSISGLRGSIIRVSPLTNYYDRLHLVGTPKPVIENQIWQYKLSVDCYRDGGDGAHLGDASYTVWVKGVPQKLKFKPNTLGSRILTKNVELTESGVNRLINPPNLVASKGTVTYSINPGLPAGLDLSSSTGVISGTPSVTSASKKYTITASDPTATPTSASFSVSIEVIDPMSFASASLADQTLTVNTAMTALNPPALSNSDGAVSYTVSPNLPGGLSISSSTGVISGTPSAAASPDVYTVTATDSRAGNVQTATLTVRIKVNPATAMAFSGTKSAQVLIAGRQASIPALSLSNSVGTVTYSISPNLPVGLSFSTSNGGITGSPNTHHSNTSYTITATDANGQTDSYIFNIEVRKLRWTSAAPASPTVTVGQGISLTAPVHVGAVNGISGYTISPAASNLPDGVTFNASNGQIAGTTTAAKAQTAFTVTLTDNASPPQQISYTVNITVNNTTPTVSFASAASAPSEGVGTHNVVLSLSPAPTATSTTVRYAVTGTAVGGADFTALTGTVSVAKGVTTVNIPVTITDDAVDDDDETIILTLSNASGYTVGSASAHTITIADNDTTPVVTFASATSNPAESVGTHNVVLNLNPAPTATSTTIRYAVTGTAGASDFTALTGTVSAAKGATTVNIQVTITDDAVDDDDETIILTLSNGSGYTVGSASAHTITIADNDAAPVSIPEITITAGSAVTEGNAATFTVNASPSVSSAITVKYTVSQNGDFVAAGNLGANKSVSLSGGSVTISVPTVGDSADEENGSVTVTLSDSSGYTLGSSKSASVTVNDDDAAPVSIPEISITGGSAVTEGANASFTVTANPAPSSTLSVAVAVTQSGDFVSSTGKNITTVQIPTSGSITLPVPTLDDNVDEANGSVTVTLKSGSGYTVSSTSGAATITVSDNDEPAPTASFASASASAAESAGTHNVAVNLSTASSSAITVSYSVHSSSTATSGSDFTALSGSLTIAAGSTSANIPIVISDDSTDEANETVVLKLSDSSDYDLGATTTYTLTITDNDAPPPNTPVVRIGAEPTVTEGGTVTFGLSASPAPSAALSVSVTVTQTGDFVASANRGTKTVTVSTSGNGTLSVPTIADLIDEANGSVTARINAGTGYSVSSSNGSATVSVLDNDVTEAAFAASTSTVGESAGTRNVVVNLSPAPAVALTLNYAVQNASTATAGSDYNTLSGSVSVSAGASSVNIPVTIRSDNADEPDETIVLTLSTGSNYTVGSASTHTLTITDNDVPSAQFNAASATAAESAGTHNVRVNVSTAPATNLTISYTVGGTATSGDFSISSSGSLSIPKGQTSATIPVTITNDSTHENAETVILTLSNGSGYALGSRSVFTLTISDDDPGVDVQGSPNSVRFTQGQQQTVNLGTVVGGNDGVTCELAGGQLPGGIVLQCTQPRLTGTATNVESQQVRVRLRRNGDTHIMTVNVNVVAPAQSSSKPKAIIPVDPPNFCRGAVSDVNDPPQQAFPTLGREVAPQRPCRGSGSLTLHNLAETLNEQQAERERGFYITAQVQSTSDYRSRFRGGADNKLYVVDSATDARYRLLNTQRMIELSLWLIVEKPDQDSNTVTRLGRDEQLNEEFSVCLPYTPTKRHPVADIARWNPSGLSWDILPLTLSESDEQICALTDQVSSFMLVHEDEPRVTEAGLPQPGTPQH